MLLIIPYHLWLGQCICASVTVSGQGGFIKVRSAVPTLATPSTYFLYSFLDLMSRWVKGVMGVKSCLSYLLCLLCDCFGEALHMQNFCPASQPALFPKAKDFAEPGRPFPHPANPRPSPCLLFLFISLSLLLSHRSLSLFSFLLCSVEDAWP